MITPNQEPQAYAHLVVHYHGPSGLAYEWYYLQRNVVARVAQLQATDCTYQDMAAAMGELAVWLLSAQLGDTINPGWGVSLVAKLRPNEGVEVEDYEEWHAIHYGGVGA